MTSGNKKVAAAAISRVQAGGGTNLSAGLFRGVDHHQQSATCPVDGAFTGWHLQSAGNCKRQME